LKRSSPGVSIQGDDDTSVIVPLLLVTLIIVIPFSTSAVFQIACPQNGKLLMGKGFVAPVNWDRYIVVSNIYV
jgi:hypothetical protein